MRQMKYSGIEWIGEIPDDWKVSRIKYFCKIINGFPFDSNDFGRDFPFKVVRIGDIQNDTVDWENCVSVLNNNIKSCNLCKDDAIIALSGATVGKTAFINDEIEDCYINQRVAIIRSTHIKYILYTLKTIGFAEYVTLSSSGSAQPNLSTGQIGNYYFLVSDKQDLIVNFLDKKCTEIDCLIAHEEAMIDELKAYKQSVITEAVTKGLDRSVPMKDSCVEWIGEIPEHWDVVRNKDLFIYSNERNYDALENVNLISLYTDKGVVQHSEIEHTTGNKAVTADGYKIVRKNDIIVNIILCWMGAIGRSEFNGVTSPAYDIYSPKKNADSRFYHYYFRTKGFNGDCFRYGRGIMLMRWRTYSDEFRAIKVVKPPIKEQEIIANYLDKKCSNVDNLISLKQEKIEELRNYKKSLIYEYVTGKKEVCE